MDWENTQRWADQKIAGLLAVAQRMGNKEIVGQDPRDKLTTKEQQYELMQMQAHALKAKITREGARTPKTNPYLAKKGPKSSQDELFDLFAERLAKKLSEMEKKKPQE